MPGASTVGYVSCLLNIGMAITVPFSSCFSVVFLNFFHQEANSRFEGGEAAGIAEGCGVVGAPRWDG